MKKVTTNITLGQILFILFTVFLASLMFFYLGARFGPEILHMKDPETQSADALLPDEKLAQEIKELLKTKKHEFTFYEVLQDKKGAAQVQPELKNEDSEQAISVETAKASAQNSQTADQSNKEAVVKGVGHMQVKIAEPTVIDLVAPETASDAAQPEQTKSVLYHLSLGSFSDEKMAQKAVMKWQKRGYEARVVSTSVAGKGKWYRLEMGSFSDLDAAQNMQRTIMERYRESARIVSRP